MSSPLPVGPNVGMAALGAASLRWLHLRQVVPSSGVDRLSRRALNLWWIALAAAEETAQGQAMAATFLALFSGHLSQDDTVWLRWREDLAASAEMRRAYSALYGRFFARGMLQSTLALRDFVSLETDTTPAGAVTVKRLCDGDIPDWIAWDPITEDYVLCEAKGALTGTTKSFRTGTPKCVQNGKEQFERVELLDAAGNEVKARGWVGASLWATDRRSREPVFLAHDPDGRGRELDEAEREVHRRALHARWLATLANGLGEPALGKSGESPSLFIQVRAPAAPDVQPPKLSRYRARLAADYPEDSIDRPSPRPHRGLYVPTLLTRFGLQPIRGQDAKDALLEAQKLARASTEPVWFVGVNRRTIDPLHYEIPRWSSTCGAVSANGLAVFDLRSILIERQFGS